MAQTRRDPRGSGREHDRIRAGSLSARHDAPAAILHAWLEERFELWVSDELIDEVTRTLSKPWFVEQVDPGVRRAAFAALAESANRVSITVAVSGVATRPEDDLVLAAAASAGADYLVTGDRQLQHLRRFQDIEIVSPRAFATILDNK